MSETILEPGSMSVEKHINYSEVTAALYDLQFIGGPDAIENARSALFRAKMGPGPDEKWMIEPGNTLWDYQVELLETSLGSTNS